MFLCHFLSKKDSKSRRKSRTKANSFPGLIRAYVRTDVRTYVRDIQIFSASWVTNYMAMDAPHARAFGARGSSAKIEIDECTLLGSSRMHVGAKQMLVKLFTMFTVPLGPL